MTASDQDQGQMQALELELRDTQAELSRLARESALAAESLRASEEFKTRLIACSRDCIKVLDLDGRLLFMNEGGMQVLEICDLGPFVNSPWTDFWEGADRDAARAAVQVARDGGIGRFVGYFETRVSHQPRWWDVVVSPVRDASGKPERLLALSRDVTGHKKNENALREAVQVNREIIEGAAEGIIVYDSELRYQLFNPFMERLTGKRAEEVLGKVAAEVFPRLVSSGIDAALKQALQGETVQVADALVPKHSADGHDVWESCTFASHRDAHGNIVGVIGLVRDVTERHLAEAELQAALEQVQTLQRKLEAENVYLQEEISKEHNFEEIVGNSRALVEVLRRVETVAPTDSTVLIVGETGCGKELIARAIHSHGARKHRPLVKLNCGAIPTGLVESELFGHMKGAFTGALERRVGRFELADGGTLFLDEVSELPLDTQVKLLRVLQEHEFEPLGSSRTIQVNVRIIAASNRDLEKAVQEGRFRADLYYRLNVLPIVLPPLRRRRSDIPLLTSFFVERFARQFGKQITGVAQDTMDILCRYDWPGNIRELQNVIERAVVLSRGPILRLGCDLLPATSDEPLAADDLMPGAPSNSRISRDDISGYPSLEQVEKRHILDILTQTDWVIEGQRGAAKILDLHPNTLRSRMKRLRIERSSPVSSHEISQPRSRNLA